MRSLEPSCDQIGEASPLARHEGKRERLHISIGPVCNNNCTFCMEEDRAKRRAANSAIDAERVREILRQGAGREEVCFTSGEPTLVEALPTYCRWARAEGYARVSLMTNGRRLSHEPYTRALLAAGLNAFYVSIHGHTRKLHDGLTRTPGSFEQTVAGIETVARSMRKDVRLHTSTVITKRNIEHLGEIYRFLTERGVHQIVFNVMQPNGRGDRHFEQLFPRYSAIAGAFAEMILRCGDAKPQAFLVDIPLCTTEAVPDFNRGFVERYRHFEVNARSTGSEDEVAKRASASPDGRFREVTRADLDAVARVKRDACRQCRFDPICEGVWQNYLRRFGWDEMLPVAHADPGTTHLT